VGDDDEVARRALQRVGTVLRGKYRIERVLGFGGMATVYQATHRNQAEFAIKMLDPKLSLRDEVLRRFLYEGYAANSVKHPGTVLVVDDDVAEDGSAFLVMELLNGAGVDALWERASHRMSVPAVGAITGQTLEVLAAAHAKGIVHRDIKPANLFLTRKGIVKVLDFGVAHALAATASGAHAPDAEVVVGTPAFMAPEQARATGVDGQTDVWALGATMFTLLSGAFVHEGESAEQIVTLTALTPARPLASVAPEVPPPIAHVVDRALAFEKSDRWPSAQAMHDALAQAMNATYGEAPSLTTLAGLLEDAPPSGAVYPEAHEPMRTQPGRSTATSTGATLAPVRPADADVVQPMPVPKWLSTGVGVPKPLSGDGQPPGSGHPSGPAGPAPADERRINAWIGTREGQVSPLRRNESRTLSFNIGPPVAASLVCGPEANVTDVPAHGLLTRWMVTSSNVELSPAESRTIDGATVWIAWFELFVPPHGETETFELSVVPRVEGAARIDVVIYAERSEEQPRRIEAYRRLTLDLPLERAADITRLEPTPLVTQDFVCSPMAELAPRTTHEWTTPPATLGLTVAGGFAHVNGDAGAGMRRRPRSPDRSRPFATAPRASETSGKRISTT
jgi:serine/threonine protein kinase